MMTDATAPSDTAPAPDLDRARADLVEAIETAGLQRSDENPGQPDDLAKVDGGKLSFELRFNGKTIALDGQDVTLLAADAFQPFLKDQKLKVEAGEADDQITAALGSDGPMKALARVRLVTDTAAS